MVEMKNYYCAVMVLSLIAGSLMGRAGLGQATQKYNEEVVAGLGLETPQSVSDKQPEDSISQEEPSPLLAYGKTIVEKTGEYTQRFEVAGAPTIVQHRLTSYELFMDRLAGDPELKAKILRVIDAHKKIAAWCDSEQVFSDLIIRFKAHLEARYNTSAHGVDAELQFKMFELLLYGAADTEAVLTRLDGFVDTYNTYVNQEFTFLPEELGISINEWPEVILGDDGIKHALLLVSFSLEQIKIGLRREPLLTELRDSLGAQSRRMAEILTAAGQEYTAEQKAQPLFMAAQCSAYVQKSIAQDGSVAFQDRAALDECMGLVEQVTQLTNDYEVVVRAFAASKTEASDQPMSPAMAPDAFEDAEPSVESLYGSDADDTTAQLGYEREQDGKKGMSPKAIAITVAISVLVVGALLEGLGRFADGKALDSKSSVWQFFSSVRPSQLLSKTKTA